MATEWMGRYRPLVAELVRHSNVVQRKPARGIHLAHGLSLSATEWQVFEYIIEHEGDDSCMNHISERLGIAQSTFSKIAKLLCSHGLVDKYQTETNRKNIILRPSPKGLEQYQQYATTINASMFDGFFKALEGLTDEQLAAFTTALERLNDTLVQGGVSEKPRLIKKT